MYIMKEVTLEELSSPGCQICKAFEEFWHSIESHFPNVRYKNISATTPEGIEMAGTYEIFASPGIVLNGELFSAGKFDKDKFMKKLKEVSQ